VQSWFAAGWRCPVDMTSASPDVLHLDHRDGAVFIKIAQEVVGNLFGIGGETLKLLQDITNCTIKVDSRNDANGQVKAHRMVKIFGRALDQSERESELNHGARVIQLVCSGEEQDIGAALSRSLSEQEVMEQEKKIAIEAEETARRKAYEAEVASYVAARCGDIFSGDMIYAALSKENWDPNQAMNNLFNERCHEDPASTLIRPALNAQKLLEASRAANSARKANKTRMDDSPASATHKTRETDDSKPSKDVMRIRKVFAEALAKGAALQEKAGQHV